MGTDELKSANPSWLQLILDELQPVTQPVYHYTDSRALLGMIQRHRVWASQATSLNDRAEVTQGWARIRKQLTKLKDSSRGAQSLLSLAERPFHRASDVYILSASTRADDANQWRLYGSAGFGYSVKFDGATPLAVTASEGVVIEKQQWGVTVADVATVSPWLPVIYEDEKLLAVLEEMAASVSVEESAIDDMSFDDEQHKDLLMENLGEQISDALAGVAHIIKSPGFAGENEARIVATTAWGNRHVRYRASSTGVVSYLELAASDRWSASTRVLGQEDAQFPLPIMSVRNGALITMRQHKQTIRDLLRINGYRETKVKTSHVPLR